ncbi:hypothetical protein EXIGLDRAFT_721864 [Exidia glandulosa HHB12029]|uniref:Uncharacterized protein n=1 Tax=Exidia glandulosa HHB12029 TaxID=1314781 RepID=A0A165N7G8_EXIGL|nr:hypothetical protein EXIGLDRAFT_721864 [Exidia glandulosa HHB12029]
MSYAPLPTPADVAATLDSIAARENDIVVKERQIQELEDQIASHRETITSIRADIAAKRNYLAPIRRLPFEILGEIVTYCTTDKDAAVQVLRDMASICRTWRDATLRTPKAWSKITFSPRSHYAHHNVPHPRPGCRMHLETARDLNEWFDRSGTCRKDVCILLTPYASRDDVARDVASLSDFIARHATQIRSYKVAGHSYGGSWDDVDLVAPLFAPQFPNLHSLTLSSIYYSSTQLALDQTKSGIIARTPSLRHLRLASEYDVGELSGLSRRQLESIIINGRTNADGLFRTQRFDALRHLSLSTFNPTLAASNTSHQLLLPQLHTLHLSITIYDEGAIDSSFLDYFRAPRLEVAVLYLGGHKITKKETGCLLRPLADISESLRTLYLNGFGLTDTELISRLAQLTTVERLAITDTRLSDKVIDALATPKNKRLRDGWLMPKLSDIMISCLKSSSAKFTVSRDALRDLAVARRSAVDKALSKHKDPPVSVLANVAIGIEHEYDSERHATLQEVEGEWTWTLNDPVAPRLRNWWETVYRDAQKED